MERKALLNNTFQTSFKIQSNALTLCDEFGYLWNSFAFASANVNPEFAELNQMLRLV